MYKYEDHFGLYSQLMDLAKQQNEMCKNLDFRESDHLKSLVGLLEEGNKVMAQIEMLPRISEAERGTSEERQLREKLLELLEIGNESEALFLEKKQGLQQDITRFQRGKIANKAYYPQLTQGDGYFLDKRK